MISGITGHQNIGSKKVIKWVKRQMEKVIEKKEIEIGYTSLAVGADQLFASVLLKNDIPYYAIIPCKNYEKTFNNDNLDSFKYYLERAKVIKKLDYNEPSEEAFYYAGLKMLDEIDIIIAVWDGKPAKGKGGTGDIVKKAINMDLSIIHINPEIKKVKFI